jgi:Flp pilus assembly pilin Flp
MTHKALLNRIKSAFNNNGQGMVEYILILGLIALAVITSLTPVGKNLADKFTEFATAISSS